jgi:hypothetical protein
MDDLLLSGDDDLSEPDDARIRIRRVSVAALNLPVLIVLVVLGGAGAGLALALAIGVAFLTGLPQLQALERRVPVLGRPDVVMAILIAKPVLLVVLPAIAGAFVGGRAGTDLPWLALLALTAWVVAVETLRVSSSGRVFPIVSIVGFFVACALCAVMGPRGSLAALGLDLFLLLPAMILTADRTDDARVEAGWDRAMGSLRGIDLLVGAWLAFLLVRHWGLWTGDVLVLVIVVAAALAAYAVVNVILLRIATHRRRMPETAWDADIPSLTIIVPCLDDGDRLDATIASLRDQTYADATILVVDGGSSDGSAAHAADLVAYDGQAISAGPAPDGWTVRRWIRRVGAETATTDLLLFVEPGTTLVPVAVRKIVEHGQRTGDALVSAVIGQAMPTWTEMAAIPGFTVFRSGFVPSWLTALTHGRPALIARWPGAVLLAGREAYVAAVTGTEDGPAPVDPTDDDIADAIVGTGGRIGIADGADVGQIRRERTYGAVLATWRRVLLPAVGGSLALAILAILAGIAAFVVPLVLPFAALFGGAEPRLLLASFVPLFLLLAFRVSITLTQRQSLLTVLTHPVTVVVALAGQVAAIVDHVTGRRHDRDREPAPD